MHFNKVIFKVTITLVLLLLITISGQAQEANKPAPVRIMFYNVENLFDTVNDSASADEEFLPEGTMRWNLSRYHKKISSIYKVITAAGEWTLPAVVGFAEVENRKVLEDLVFGTYLSGFNYGIIHVESPDTRGIDACLIFRKDIVSILKIRSMIPSTVPKSNYHSRSVLYVKCRVSTDTLHLFVNHWPSRRGGVLAGEDLREKIAEMVWSAADSIDRRSNRKSKIIIMGDFNCGPDNMVMQRLVNHPLNSGDSGVRLVNLADNDKNGPGTYRFQGTWETLDQIVISDWLLSCKSGIYTTRSNFKIFKPDFLLVNDPKYPGQSPYSTYRGYRYLGGFSDHLPVILDLWQK